MGGKVGLWQGLLNGQYNDILLTKAVETDDGVKAQKAWATFAFGVLTAPIPGAEAFSGLNSTLKKMATTGVDSGKSSLEDRLLGDAAFPEDANLNAARDAAVGATDDATYAGQAMLIQWALENDMVDQELIPKEWKRDLPDGITAKHPYGYTVDPKKAGGDFRDFVQENGAVAMTRLKLDSQYLLALAVDPATPYIKPK